MSVVGVPPEVTPQNEYFWNGTARGELLAERCRACGRFSAKLERLIAQPEGECPYCHATDMDYVAMSSPGVIAALTLNYKAWTPETEVPYGLVEVEFPDCPGVSILGRLSGFDDLTAVRIGDQVAIGVEEGPGGYMIPSFRPWAGQR
jgi:hypothetical protein